MSDDLHLLSEEESRRLAELEEAHQDDLVARHRAIRAAAAAPGLLGELRREISAARRNPDELAAACGIDVRRLEDFRAGEVSLTDAELASVAAALGLHLTRLAAV